MLEIPADKRLGRATSHSLQYFGVRWHEHGGVGIIKCWWSKSRLDRSLSLNDSEEPARDYYRRDEKAGVSPPNLAKECTFAEHIVHARGKRTQYTSVSLDLSKIRDFGDADYRLERELLLNEGHSLVEHQELIAELRRVAIEEQKEDRLRAIQALRYATKRKEGLVHWCFNTAGIPRKDLIAWAEKMI